MRSLFARAPWRARWLGVPLLAGATLSIALEPTHLPIVGPEKVSEVVLVDGQVYFGHVTDVPFSDTITIRDVYYFQDARGAPSARSAVALAKRGDEVHGPADGLHVRRAGVLLIEEVGIGSSVMRAIATQRSLERVVKR